MVPTPQWALGYWWWCLIGASISGIRSRENWFSMWILALKCAIWPGRFCKSKDSLLYWEQVVKYFKVIKFVFDL
jgi:hypothetical protein